MNELSPFCKSSRNNPLNLSQETENKNKNLQQNQNYNTADNATLESATSLSAPAYGQNAHISSPKIDPLELTGQTNANLASVYAPAFQSQENEQEEGTEESLQNESPENADPNSAADTGAAPVQIETETEEDKEGEVQEGEKEIETPPEDQNNENQEASEENAEEAEANKDGKEAEEKEAKEGLKEEMTGKTEEITEQSEKAEENKEEQTQQINEDTAAAVLPNANGEGTSPLSSGDNQKGITSNPTSDVQTDVKQFLYAVSEDELQNFDPSQIISENPNGSFTISSPEKLTGLENSESIIEIDQSVVENLMADRKAQNDASLQAFLAGNENKIGDIKSQTAASTSNITATLASATAQIMAAEQVAISTVESSYASAVAAAESTAETALATFSTEFSTTVAGINSEYTTGLSNLSSALATSLETGVTLQSTIVDASNVKFDEAAQKMIDEGVRMGNLAMEAAQAQAAIEDAKPIPKMSRSARFFEGGDYEKNKHDARVNACISVGEGMQKSFNETAAQASQSLLESKGQTASDLSGKFSDLTTSLQTEHDAKVQEIEAAKASAMTAAQAMLDGAIASVTAQKAGQLEVLATTHSAKLAEISNSAAQQRTQLQTTGTNLRSQLEATIAEGLNKLRAINDSVALEAAELEKVEVDQFQEFLNDGAQNFSAESQNFISLVASSTSSACSSLSEAGMQAQQALNEMATGASTAFTEATASFDQAITALSSSVSQQFSGLATGFTAQITSTVSGATTSFSDIITNAEAQFQTAVEGVASALESAIQEVVVGFESELGKIGSLMATKADEAEAAVQPRWKSIVKIIIEVVIAIAVIIAVTALAASGVGLLFIIVGAIVIGAAAGVVKQLANNALDGKPLTEGLGTAAAFGALDGLTALIGGGVGGAIAKSLATKVTSTAAKFAVTYVASTVVEATVDSVGSGIKNVVTNIQAGNGFSIGAFVDGFKQDFVKNLLINAAANGLMEIPAVKGLMDKFGSAVASRVNGSSVPTSAVDIPSTSVTPKPDVEISTPKVDPVIPKPEVDVAPPKADVEVSPKPDVEVAPKPDAGGAPKPEAEVSPKPEAEVTPKPETEVAPKPEAEPTPKAEAETEVSPKTDAEVGPKAETEVAPKAEAETPEVSQSPSALKAADEGLPPAPDGYFYNQSKDGTLYIQRKSKVDAEGNPVPQLKIEGTKLVDETGNIVSSSVKDPSQSMRGMKYESVDDFAKSFDPDKKLSSTIRGEAYNYFQQGKWAKLEDLFNANGVNAGWPPNRGFVRIQEGTMDVGYTFDRYGGYTDNADGLFKDKGTFVSPDGASFESRALPASTQSKPYKTYEVIKEIPGVKSGEAIPWFGQPGMGIQHELPESILNLLKGGFIREITI